MDINLEYYEDNYKRKNESFSFEVKSKTRIFERLYSKLKINSSLNVLDAGFGSGDILYYLKNKGHFCYGTEISKQAISNIEQDFANRLVAVSSEKIPFKDGFFDIVVSSHSLEHMKNEKTMLNEMKRVLKDGGFLILGVPSINCGYNPLHYREYSRRDFDRMANETGLALVNVETYGSKLFGLIIAINGAITEVGGASKIRKQTEQRELSLKETLYYRLVVPTMITAYMLDRLIPKGNGLEIWGVFRK